MKILNEFMIADKNIEAECAFNVEKFIHLPLRAQIVLLSYLMHKIPYDTHCQIAAKHADYDLLKFCAKGMENYFNYAYQNRTRESFYIPMIQRIDKILNAYHYSKEK